MEEHNDGFGLDGAHEQKGAGTGGKKRLVIAMVGLPGRGKTFLAQKLCRYLCWLSYKAKVFNIGKYRFELYGAQPNWEFFNTEDGSTYEKWKRVYAAASADVEKYLSEDGGHVAIYDAANTSEDRRNIIRHLTAVKEGRNVSIHLIWVEVIETDTAVIDNNIREFVRSCPEFSGIPQDTAFEWVRKRIAIYDKTYKRLGDEHSKESYVQLFNQGDRIVTNKIRGYLPSKVVFFLMSFRACNHDIYISRHGESQYNTEDRLGGDSPLSQRGVAYSKALTKFFISHPPLQGQKMSVWCSTLRRTGETAQGLQTPPVVWKALDEIDAGICDGLTYAEVKEKFPEIDQARSCDKLRFRYPEGESYEDVIARLEPVIFELNRINGPVLVVAHRAVLRCLYAYYLDIPSEDIPYLSVPLHTVIHLQPKAYGCEETRYPLGVSSVDDARSDETLISGHGNLPKPPAQIPFSPMPPHSIISPMPSHSLISPMPSHSSPMPSHSLISPPLKLGRSLSLTIPTPHSQSRSPQPFSPPPTLESPHPLKPHPTGKLFKPKGVETLQPLMAVASTSPTVFKSNPLPLSQAQIHAQNPTQPRHHHRQQKSFADRDAMIGAPGEQVLRQSNSAPYLDFCGDMDLSPIMSAACSPLGSRHSVTERLASSPKKCRCKNICDCNLSTNEKTTTQTAAHNQNGINADTNDKNISDKGQPNPKAEPKPEEGDKVKQSGSGGVKSPLSGGVKSPASGGVKSPLSGGVKSPLSGGGKSPSSAKSKQKKKNGGKKTLNSN